MDNLKFFKDTEIAGLVAPLPQMLDAAREAAGIPFILTATTGGPHCTHSAHFLGLAVDIGLGHLAAGFARDTARWAIMKGLYAAGFKRIEDAPLHIHADIGSPPTYPSPVHWMGTDG